LRSYERNKQNRNVPVIWDSATAVNPHWLIVGSSGTGKTFTIRRLVQSMVDQHAKDTSRAPFRIHVFDVHGDILLDARGLSAFPTASVVQFSESTQFGLNPLDVDPDPHFGGVRRRIQGLLGAINHTSRQLGSKQEAVLRAILLDLYAANGYHENNPASWRSEGDNRGYPKKSPTLVDALRFAAAKHKAMYLGTNSKAIACLDAVNKRAAALHSKARLLAKVTMAGDTDRAEKVDEELEKLIDGAQCAYEQALRAIRTGHEMDDAIRYDSRDVLKSIVERLENLSGTGIFRATPPPFGAAASLWGYDIRALPEDEKKLFVRFRIEQIFQRARQRGQQSRITEVLVVDEAHLFFDDDASNPLNVLALEGRKFGISLMCASQAPQHFSDDFLSNTATKLLMGLDEMFWDGACRKLKIEPDRLRWIKPAKTMAASIKVRGDLSSAFVNVDVDPGALL